jgi:ferredoxin
MKSIICYYSSIGNTRLACEAIARAVPCAGFELFDITSGAQPNLAGSDFTGFATFADFWGPPQLMKTFIEALPTQANRPAFVFNTFGGVNGGTLYQLARLARGRGFQVLAAHALHTPESYPVVIAGGRTFINSPSKKELDRFREFLRNLSQVAAEIKAGGGQEQRARRFGLAEQLWPVPSRTTARRTMGDKLVDAALCSLCGICATTCPYEAIRMNPGPEFDARRCYGCWGCFNRCPRKAIYTRKLRGEGHYPQPANELNKKLATIEPLTSPAEAAE